MIKIEKKQFKYRGIDIDELKKLDVREFAKFLKSRGRRTVLRQFQEIEKFVSECKKKISRKKIIRTHKRDIVIVPEMVGMKIYVHNGNKFISVEVIGEMLGHRLGEFAATRARIKHGVAGVGATKGTKAQAKK